MGALGSKNSKYVYKLRWFGVCKPMAKENNQVKTCNNFVEAMEMSMFSCLVTNVQLTNAGNWTYIHTYIHFAWNSSSLKNVF